MLIPPPALISLWIGAAENQAEHVDISQYIAERLHELAAIERALMLVEEDSQKEEERHRTAVGKLAAQRASVQHSCLHQVVRYYPDASGNNDSSYSCEVCRKDLGKNPAKPHVRAP